MRTAISVSTIACLVLGCGGNEGPTDVAEPAGFEHPHEAFEAMQAALGERDMAAFVACLTPDSADRFVGDLVAYFSLPPEATDSEEDQKKAEAIAEILDRHGVGIEVLDAKFPSDPKNDVQLHQRYKAVGALVEDKGKLVSELSQLLEGDGMRPLPADAKLIDVKIDGDKASGFVQFADGKKDPFPLRRIDGRWFVHVPSPLDG